ncbi:phosphonate ABC transporter, permease protein PhnE [Zavarzinia aquatilis]|nr:phosphonate ABC transporter, permease protein PhnE [Zavarzinia aquatilis]
MSTSTHLSPEMAVRAQIESRKRLYAMAGWLALIGLLVLSYGGAGVDFGKLWNNRDNIATLAWDFVPAHFLTFVERAEWSFYIGAMWETVQIAIWGTFLAVVCAVPFGLMCSTNVAPWWIVQPTRRVMDALRAINEIVFALLFVVAVGLGPFAGTLALFLHTTGILAKLFSEAVEAIDHRPVEGIRATGATSLEEIVYGIVPQVMPLWVSYALYRFESNVRSAAVLGIVGAGGIGMVLYEELRSFNYPTASVIMVIIIVAVSLLDMLSARLRKFAS